MEGRGRGQSDTLEQVCAWAYREALRDLGHKEYGLYSKVAAKLLMQQCAAIAMRAQALLNVAKLIALDRQRDRDRDRMRQWSGGEDVQCAVVLHVQQM